MAFHTPYRRFVAAILLAVYWFIATPVQYWHHHTIVSSTELAFVTDDDTACSVCSHQYSIYHDTAPLELAVTINVTDPEQGGFHLQMISTPGYSASNKGPPATA